ncbi:MAG: substrate-binding domain-containing protein [Actinomycetota bacterium]
MKRIALSAALLLSAVAAQAEERFITLASTTSTEQSGLFAAILPAFERDTGIKVHVVAVGTGQALKLGERGDADALLVHDRAGEDKFVAEGFGIDRRDVMHNDFVVVGPAADPARIKGVADVAEGFRRIAAAKAPFASRGDDSGTHRMELRLWKAVGVDVKEQGTGWYRDLGSGMGPTLNTAAGMGAYTLADRGTWASFKNRQGLTILLEGDSRLFNPYGSILVNPERHPGVKAELARHWHQWLTGPKGQAAIALFRIGDEQLFFPDAK